MEVPKRTRAESERGIVEESVPTPWYPTQRFYTFSFPQGKGKSGRMIANVLLPDGTNVNHELVKVGLCWWYRKYAPGDTVLEGLENEPREVKKGLWIDPQPEPPWEWRNRNDC